ncbi:MAG: hypothetical protein KA715_09885 [Xanthomonadaceae bacterium]|nr:hypothetical protein [Xanthomonadaceae bacterium]
MKYSRYSMIALLSTVSYGFLFGQVVLAQSNSDDRVEIVAVEKDIDVELPEPNGKLIKIKAVRSIFKSFNKAALDNHVADWIRRLENQNGELYDEQETSETIGKFDEKGKPITKKVQVSPGGTSTKEVVTGNYFTPKIVLFKKRIGKQKRQKPGRAKCPERILPFQLIWKEHQRTKIETVNYDPKFRTDQETETVFVTTLYYGKKLPPPTIESIVLVKEKAEDFPVDRAYRDGRKHPCKHNPQLNCVTDAVTGQEFEYKMGNTGHAGTSSSEKKYSLDNGVTWISEGQISDKDKKRAVLIKN